MKYSAVLAMFCLLPSLTSAVRPAEAQLEQDTSKLVMTAAFNALDTDHNGAVSFAEFTAALNKDATECKCGNGSPCPDGEYPVTLPRGSRHRA